MRRSVVSRATDVARAAASSRLVRLATGLVGFGLMAALVLRLVSQWHSHPIEIRSAASAALLLCAVATAAAGVAAHAAVWRWILRQLGASPPTRIFAAYFAGQLGKYLPGTAWQYVGRAALARELGVPVAVGSSSLVVEAALSAFAACALGTIAGGLAGALAAAVCAACLSAAAFAAVRGRSSLTRGAVPLAARGVVLPSPLAAAALRVVVAYVGVWLLYGVAFWLLAAALFSASISTLTIYVGVFSLAYVAGFVAVFAPGGLGVRELVIIALLRGRLGSADAVSLATASRLALTAVDAVAGAAALASYGKGALRRLRVAAAAGEHNGV